MSMSPFLLGSPPPLCLSCSPLFPFLIVHAWLHWCLQPLQAFERLHLRTSQEPETQHEENFQKLYSAQLTEALEALKNPQDPFDSAGAWAPFKQVGFVSEWLNLVGNCPCFVVRQRPTSIAHNRKKTQKSLKGRKRRTLGLTSDSLTQGCYESSIKMDQSQHETSEIYTLCHSDCFRRNPVLFWRALNDGPMKS